MKKVGNYEMVPLINVSSSEEKKDESEKRRKFQM